MTGPTAGPAAPLTPAQRSTLERLRAPVGRRSGLFPATGTQRGLWFLDQLAPGRSTYHLPVALRLRGDLDATRLVAALDRLADRHESLRTTVVGVEGRPLQRVRPAGSGIRVDVVDAAGRSLTELIGDLTEQAHQSFDLARGPLVRARIWRRAPDDHVLLLVLHHIIADGWSMGVLLTDLIDGLRGASDTGPAPGPTPVDLALREAATAPSVDYWIGHLDGAGGVHLPEEPEADAPTAGVSHVDLPDELRDRIRRFAADHGATEYALYFAALAAVVYRFTADADVTLGVPFAHRGDPGAENTVGLLVNTMPVRLRATAGATFADLLADAGTVLRDGLRHEAVPFASVVPRLVTDRTGAHAPLLDLVLVVNPDPLPIRRAAGLDLHLIPVAAREPKFPMTVAVEPAGLAVEYDARRFPADLVTSLATAFRQTLEEVVRDPSVLLDRIALRADDRWIAQARGPVGTRILRADGGLGAVFGRIAAAQPDRIALTDQHGEVTYGALADRVDRLAGALRDRGVDQASPVAVHLPRGIDQVVACLAVVRAGGVYLPLDPSYPTARLAAQLADGGARWVITDPDHRDRFADQPVETLTVHDQPTGPGRPAAVIHPDDLAMVVYTSGSSGRPKGIGITHRGIARLVADQQPGRHPDHCYLHLAAVAFDASTWEIWSTLLTGARGVLLGPHEYTAAGIARAIRDHGVTTALLTTALFNAVVDEDPHALTGLRRLLVGGEALSADHVRRAAQAVPATRIVNAYGPAEVTVIATTAELGPVPPGARQVPIGEPIVDTEVYLLDAALQPVPDGAIGEIYVGGPGLARGYIGAPALTARSFVPSPFHRGARLYRTGDLARRTRAGLVFAGRVDQQIKIRGHRIEPGEIESQLRAFPEVGSALVTVRDGRLVGYVVPATGRPPAEPGLDAADLRARLALRLPDYLVPAAIQVLVHLPLTTNGKVDLAALPAPNRPAAGPPGAPLSTATQRLVAVIWADQIRLPATDIDADTDFFAIGGHSLLATLVVAHLSTRLNRPVPLGLVFAHPRLADFAAAVAAVDAGAFPVAEPVPIPRGARTGSAPLSFGQRRMWLLQQLKPDLTMFNLPLTLRLVGTLDVAALTEALRLVIARHQPLRSIVEIQDGEPTARVLAEHRVNIAAVPVSDRDTADAMLRDALATPFDLAAAPPIRATLLRLPGSEHFLQLTVHHIAFDGLSAALLAGELSAAYTALRAGTQPRLAPLPIEYGDYTTWQHGRAAHEFAAGLDYWQQALAGAPVAVELPTDRPRPAVLTYRGATLPIRLGPARTAEVHRIARAHGVTPFMALLTGYALLLRRYSGTDDLVIGTPVAERNHPDLEYLIGCLIDVLPLRLDLADHADPAAVLRMVRQRTLAAFAHQGVPFERIVDRVRPHRDRSTTPIFNTLITVQTGPAPACVMAGLDSTPHPVANPHAQYDLSLTLQEGADGFAGALEYNPDLFDRATVEQLRAHLLDEYDQLIHGRPDDGTDVAAARSGRATRVPEVSVADLVRAGTADGPDRILVFDSDGAGLTGTQLWRRAGGVADALRAAGVRRGDLVGVCLSRRPELVAAILGVWLTGAAYLPIDPRLPDARRAWMAEDAGLRVALVDATTAALIPATLAAVTTDTLPDGEPTGRVSTVAGTDAAYVLYTSGSTGTPKAVVVPHHAVVNLLRLIADEVGLGRDDVLLAVTTLSFDISLVELFGPLIVGGRVVVATADQAREPAAVSALLDRCRVTVVQATPAWWTMLLDGGANLRPGLRAWLGGEALPTTLATRLRDAGVRLWNLYGPTETTIYSIGAEVTDPHDITLGGPLTNTDLHLLDADMRAVPPGAVGEIYLAGAGVATGYLHRPALTAQRFLPSPRSPGARMYRTGDLGRLRRDGVVVYHGRADDQVKIRGFRVELGEVESALRGCDGVTEAAAAVHDQALVGYVTGDVDTALIRAELRRHLPEYLVPGSVIVLPALPRTPSGKTDRRALPPPPRPGADDRLRVGPRGPMELAAVTAWAEALAIPAEQLSIVDDIFAAGAHSLLAARVAARLSARLRRTVPVRLVYENSTPVALAYALARLPIDDGRPELLRHPVTDDNDLSFAQRRLWFTHQFEPESVAYNVPLAMELAGRLDVPALAAAITAVVARHATLRTSFAVVGGQPRARTHPPRPVALCVVDVRAVSDAAAATVRDIGYAAFDLSTTAPLRAALVLTGPDRQVLVLATHHIACDGWSSAIIGRDLTQAYIALRSGNQPQLGEPGIAYADFASWQREWLTGPAGDALRSHWSAVLAGAPAALELPTDHPRPAVLSSAGASVPLDFGAPVTAAVRALAGAHDVTDFMVLVAAFAVLLSRYTGQRDILIGTPAAGRDHPAVEQVVGFFANTLVIRVDLTGRPTVAQLLGRVRDAGLTAYDHGELPFEQLVEHVAPARDLSRTPIFQVLIGFQQDPVPPVDLPGVRTRPYPVDNPTAKYELVLSLRDGPEITGVLEYHRDLFAPATADRLRDGLREVLAAMAAAPTGLVDDLAVEPADRRHRLQVAWNRTPARYDPDSSLDELVERQCTASPGALALIDDETGEQLTYAELDRRANQVAVTLRARGVGRDDLVGLLVPRGTELVVGALGILRSGAGYLPLDPEHPMDRLRAVLTDAGVTTTLTVAATADLGAGHPQVRLDTDPVRTAPDDPVALVSTPGSLAYAIYTSGSTGRPKGALIEHRAIVNNLLWMQQDWPLDRHDRVLQKTTAAFDVSVKEIFWPLLAGATVVLARPGGQRDPEYLTDLIDRRGITVAHFVPSMLEAALGYAAFRGRSLGASLEKVMAGAETLPAATLRRFHAEIDADLLHMYGPTETAIAVTGWTCPRGETPARIPLGRPMPLVELYVLDPAGRPVPQGAWGELSIGGISVGRGYLGRPAETAAAFVPDPYSGRPGARLYRTGDVTRINNDELLEFRGRMDAQVKVHGFRIELGEIEVALTRHPMVRQAAVVTRASAGGEHRLVGYVGTGSDVADPGASAATLREHLRATLPDYMIPQLIVVLDRLPLNPNGKIDRAALPAPDAEPVRVTTPPRTHLERAVATAVCQVLGLSQIGIHDDLFALGGHSLQVPQLAALLAEHLDVDVPLREVFLDPTVAGITRAVDAARATRRDAPIIPVDRAARRRAHAAEADT